MSRAKREALLSARTTPTTAGTVKVKEVKTIDGKDVSEFEEILLYYKATQLLVGTGRQVDVYVQRAVVTNPDWDNDAHWSDLGAFGSMTDTLLEQIMPLGYRIHATDTELTTGVRGRDAQGITPGRSRPGHWFDRIRIMEKVTGTSISQAAIYDIYAVGLMKAPE